MQYITFHLTYNIKIKALLNFLTNDPYGRGALNLNKLCIKKAWVLVMPFHNIQGSSELCAK